MTKLDVPMDCERAGALYLDALEGRLAATEARAVKGHVAACVLCQREAEFLEKLGGVARHLRAQITAVWENPADQCQRRRGIGFEMAVGLSAAGIALGAWLTLLAPRRMEA